MKYRKITLVITSLLVFAALVYGEPNDFKPVSSNDVNDVLNMIAAHIQDNYYRINTWEGEIENTTYLWRHGQSAERAFREYMDNNEQAPEEIKQTLKGNHFFLVDSKKDNLLIRSAPVGKITLLDIKTNRSYDSGLQRSEGTVITTPDYQIKCDPYRLHHVSKETIQRMATKKPVSGNIVVVMGESDPRIALKGRGLPVWFLLESMAKKGLGREGYSIKLEEKVNNGLVDYRLEIPGIDNGTAVGFFSMLFSGSKGFLVTDYELRDKAGNLQAKETTDFTLIDGIYLPARIHYAVYEANGKMKEDRTQVFKNMRVNKTIPEDSFTYKNLGLKDGDLFDNKIEGKKYKYQDANLVPIAEPNKPPK